MPHPSRSLIARRVGGHAPSPSRLFLFAKWNNASSPMTPENLTPENCPSPKYQLKNAEKRLKFTTRNLIQLLVPRPSTQALENHQHIVLALPPGRRQEEMECGRFKTHAHDQCLCSSAFC